MRFLIVGATFVAAIASSAHAADMPIKAQPLLPVAATNWTGCYLGASGGGVWSNNDDSFADGDFANSGISASSWVAGGTWGCNVQVSTFVFGYEGDYSWTDLSGSQPSTTSGFSHTVKQHWLMTNRGRLGYAYNNVLFYGTGGLATSRVEVADTDTSTGQVATEAQTLWGWTAGAGIEYALMNKWSVKLEYLYVWLPSSFLSPNSLGSPLDQHNLHDQVVRVGLNYRF